MNDVNRFNPRPGVVVIRGITSEETLAKTDKLLGGAAPEGEIGSEFKLVFNRITGNGSYFSESHSGVGNIWENEQKIHHGRLSENESVNLEKRINFDYDA